MPLMDDPLTRGFDGVIITKGSNMPDRNPIRFLNFSGRVYFSTGLFWRERENGKFN